MFFKILMTIIFSTALANQEIPKPINYSTCSACTKTPAYLVKTREWQIFISKRTNVEYETYCLKRWEELEDMCPDGWKVIHTDPLTYRIDYSPSNKYSMPITCIKMVTCESPE